MAAASGDVKLPAELSQRLVALFELDRAPTTLRAVLAELAARGFVPSLDQLCATGASRHRLITGSGTMYMNCVLDALLLPLLTGESGEVVSESPVSGSPVTARVSSEGIAFDPPAAVVSFGAALDPGLSGTEALCAFHNAFVSPAEYEAWEARTPEAITVMLPLARAYAFEREYVERALARQADGNA